MDDHGTCDTPGCDEPFHVVFGDPYADDPQLALCQHCFDRVAEYATAGSR